MRDYDDFKWIRLTEAALAQTVAAQTVADRLFVVETQETFDYNIYIDTIDALQEWRDVLWDSYYLPDETEKWVTGLFENQGETASLIVHMSARITRLRVI